MPISHPAPTFDDLERSLRNSRKRLKRAIERIAGSHARATFTGLSDDRREAIARAGSAINSQVRALTRVLTKKLSLDHVEGDLKRARRRLRRVLRRIAPPGARTAFDTLNSDQRDAIAEAGASIHGLIADLRGEVDAALHPVAAKAVVTANPAMTSKRAGRGARILAAPVAAVPALRST